MSAIKGFSAAAGTIDHSFTNVGPFLSLRTNLNLPAIIPKTKKGACCFMSAVVVIFVYVYFSYVIAILGPLIYPKVTTTGLVLGVIFHVIYFMTVFSYIKCVITDPGRIPRHWAFYRGDVNKRRRYCKQCNAWKPSRTHHCSSCQRCVLNMDHHCPWINNCVGFYNRKFFLHLLVYGVHGLAMILVHSLSHVAGMLWTHVASFSALYNVHELVFLIIATLLTATSGILFFAMVQFTAFHIKLVSTNLTTIESLDHNTRERGNYDLGISRNCQQVFGPTILLWWLPHHTLTTAPVGDGVRWTTCYASHNMEIL